MNAVRNEGKAAVRYRHSGNFGNGITTPNGQWVE